jgi:hypothetical protein
MKKFILTSIFCQYLVQLSAHSSIWLDLTSSARYEYSKCGGFTAKLNCTQWMQISSRALDRQVNHLTQMCQDRGRAPSARLKLVLHIGIGSTA